MKEIFIQKTFNARHAALIATADRIMRTYSRQGYDLSLRQLYLKTNAEAYRGTL